MSSHSGSGSDKPYRLNILSLNDADYATIVHELDATSVRRSVPLGDTCGLTKLGVNLVHLPPHTNSSELHWHSADDEWVYVLDAGKDGGTLITLPRGASDTKEETVHKGDFLAFPAQKRLAHVLRAGDEELVYLCSGTRAPIDVCTYPKAGKRLVIDRSDGGDTLLADEKDLLIRRDVG